MVTLDARHRVAAAVTAATADVPAGSVVLVACSGGRDSLALADGAATAALAGGWSAAAVVVDHGLQEGSSAAASAAAAACLGRGLAPVEVVRVEVVSAGRGVEAAARDERYRAVAATADRLGAVAVLLGHTADDQAEQVLLGLVRGSGGRSLAGMPAVRDRWRRPLLGLTRATTTAACQEAGLSPWDDPTNDHSHPDAGLRSRIRDVVLPMLEDELGPGVAAALTRTADQLREDTELLDRLATDLLTAARVTAPPDDATSGAACTHQPTAACPGESCRDVAHLGQPAGGGPAAAAGAAVDVVLDVATLSGAPAALRRRAIRAAAVQVGSPPGALHRVHVLAMDALVTRWHGQGPVALPGPVSARRHCGRLILARNPDDPVLGRPAPGRPGSGTNEQGE